MNEELMEQLLEELRNIRKEITLLRETISPYSSPKEESQAVGEPKLLEEKKEDPRPRNGKHRTLIISDSDLDGILSAAAICLENNFSEENSKIIFSNPLHIHKHIETASKPLYDQVYVADIGVNNRDSLLTWSFLEAIEGKLVKWYDHHRGWREFINRNFMKLGERDPKVLGFILDESAESCTEIITHNPRIVTIARESDNPVRETMSNLTTILKNANNLDPHDYYTKYEIMTFIRDYALGNDVHDCNFFNRLNEKSARYMEIDEETNTVVEEGELFDNVLVLNQRGKRMDITKAMFLGYKTAAFVVVKIKRAEGQVCRACGQENPPIVDGKTCGNCGAQMIDALFKETFYVGTKYRNLDLPKIFNLSNGYPHRVVLKGFTVEEIVEKLTGVNGENHTTN